MPLSELNEKYAPLLLSSMKNGNAEIRRLCCDNMVKFLQINYDSKKRNEIIKHLYDNFMKSKSYQKRMTYLEFSFFGLQVFTFNFLKLYIIPDCFELANDKVPNVRLKLCRLLPEIRNYIFPTDFDTLNKFQNVLDKLLEDKILDVYEVNF